MTGPENLPSPERDEAETIRHEALRNVVSEYLDADDAEFLDDMEDEDELIGYVYGRLLEAGEDPDIILQEAGVTEGEDEV